MAKIIENKIMCKRCGKIIKSESLHSFVICSCSKCGVDGGLDYIRRMGREEDYIELSIIEDDLDLHWRKEINMDTDVYTNEQIEKIQALIKEGATAREILDKNEFCVEALDACNIPVSYLVPGLEGREMTLQEWDTHTSYEGKWEYIDFPFNSERERDKVLIGLLYTCGLKHLLEILPEQTIIELRGLLKQGSL